MAEIVQFKPVEVSSGYRFDADTILDGAKGNEFDILIVVGQLANGETWISSTANAGEAIILMERAKRDLIFGTD